MSALLDRQIEFALAVSQLIVQAHELGYEVTLGEAWRSDETAALDAKEGKGIKNSLHRLRLAIDLNVFKEGVLLTDGAQYEDLGKWWEGLGGTWGQRFSKPDGDHFSFAWEGVK